MKIAEQIYLSWALAPAGAKRPGPALLAARGMLSRVEQGRDLRVFQPTEMVGDYLVEQSS